MDSKKLMPISLYVYTTWAYYIQPLSFKPFYHSVFCIAIYLYNGSGCLINC